MHPAGIVLVLLIGVVIAAEEDKYTSKYDNVNVDSILTNNRVLGNYVKCLMEEGPCTAEGRELKRALPDALATGCVKCNENQKKTAERVIKQLQLRKDGVWERLTKKYDPKGEYKKRYEAQAKEATNEAQTTAATNPTTV